MNMIKFLKYCISIISAILIFSGGSIVFAQEEKTNDKSTTQTEQDEKEELKKAGYIDLLDSGDYVVILRTNQKVRVKSKPTIKGDLAWMYVKKKSGQYVYQKIDKELIDYEATEEYNRKLSEDRAERVKSLELSRKIEEDKMMKEAIEKGKITTQTTEGTRVYTQADLKSKSRTVKVASLDDIVDLSKYPDWTATINPGEKYEDTIISVYDREGEEIITAVVKSLLSVQNELTNQIKAYQSKIDELIKKGESEGDRFKYNQTVVEMQAIMQNLEDKDLSIKKMLDKVPEEKEEENKYQ